MNQPTGQGQRHLDCRKRYDACLRPLFFPDDPIGPDIVHLFSTLLRISGTEDAGWDPYAESRAVLEDLHVLLQLDVPESEIRNIELMRWRLGLVLYLHIVEMSAPYEVLTNLLRFKLGHGYRLRPYDDFLQVLSRKRDKKREKSALFPSEKIEIIKHLSRSAGIRLGDVFDEFYQGKIRNAVAHSDYILFEDKFRCRSDHPQKFFELPCNEVGDLILKATAFAGVFFSLEREARRSRGEYASRPVKYDLRYKGIIETLVDSDRLMIGFKVHWPNGSDSVYRRKLDGVEMTNWQLNPQGSNWEMLVGKYARNPGDFSPLVESGAMPTYTPMESGLPIAWSAA